jgi:hypothetical protein
MGIIVDFQAARQKKHNEAQRVLLTSYEELNRAIHQLRARCPLIDCSEPVHPTIKHVNDLLGELFAVKEKLRSRVDTENQSSDSQQGN